MGLGMNTLRMRLKYSMIIPVRCFSCGKVIGDKWEPFVRRVAAGEKPKAVLDILLGFGTCSPSVLPQRVLRYAFYHPIKHDGHISRDGSRPGGV